MKSQSSGFSIELLIFQLFIQTVSLGFLKMIEPGGEVPGRVIPVACSGNTTILKAASTLIAEYDKYSCPALTGGVVAIT